jgi:formate-dependent nitrite reductase cytochrome c552 subunit
LPAAVQSVRVIMWVVSLAACGGDAPRKLRPPPGPPTGTVEIHQPARLTSVATGNSDAQGRPERVACVTCHTLRTPTALPTSVNELDEFHQDLRFAHGDLSCASCHVAGDQRSLRLADGSTLDMRDAMNLCRQCHGPQFRDYQHGSHGGMTGHWDLSVGGRVRNHCVDCHDPHTPAFQPTLPVLPPRDHGLTRQPRGKAH